MSWVLAVLVLAGPSPESVQAQEKLREGQHLMSAERFEEAADAFRQSILFDPLLMMAHYGLGQAHMALKRYPSAVNAFQGARDAFSKRDAETMSLTVENESARQDRIRNLQDNIRQTEQVRLPPGSRVERQRQRLIQEWEMEIASLRRSSRDSLPKNQEVPPGLLLALGSAHFRAGELVEAEREYRAALALRPRLGECLNNLAAVLVLTGRAAEARKQLKLAEESGFKPHPGLKEDIEKALASASGN